LRKLMLLAAVLAMVLVAAAPALGQVGQGVGIGEAESGDVEPSAEIANKGDSSNACVALLQQANAGNVQNAQAVLQYAVKESGDIELEGSLIELNPALAAECQQTIEQAAAAGPGGEAKAGKAEAKAGPAEAKAGKAEAKAGEAKAEAKAAPAEAKAGEKKELPKTGGSAGSASLLALGAGALLVGGGLLARRIIR
jgi:LPXTG-motif cell wall-anchored protein